MEMSFFLLRFQQLKLSYKLNPLFDTSGVRTWVRTNKTLSHGLETKLQLLEFAEGKFQVVRSLTVSFCFRKAIHLCGPIQHHYRIRNHFQ